MTTKAITPLHRIMTARTACGTAGALPADAIFRPLALFGRRPPEHVRSSVTGERSGGLWLFDRLVRLRAAERGLVRRSVTRLKRPYLLPEAPAYSRAIFLLAPVSGLS